MNEDGPEGYGGTYKPAFRGEGIATFAIFILLFVGFYYVLKLLVWLLSFFC